MQYNVGRFNYGNTKNEGLPADIYDKKLLGLKKLFTTYQPDIVGMQEVLEYLDHAETHKSNDVLFDVFFPFKTDLFNYKRAIKGKYPVTYVATKKVPVIIDGIVFNVSFAHCQINIEGRLVDIATTALPSYSNEFDRRKREVVLPLILDEFANSEYAFIILDMNNGGNRKDISSKEEGKTLLQIARGKGWNFANGGDVPFQVTYVIPKYLYRQLVIDNIIYKNNGNIIFNDFKVLTDEYENLASDHAPIYADFLLN